MGHNLRSLTWSLGYDPYEKQDRPNIHREMTVPVPTFNLNTFDIIVSYRWGCKQNVGLRAAQRARVLRV